MITPLHEQTFPLSIQNQDFYEKYILPNVWEGYLWVNGGWGLKDEIAEITAHDPIQGFKLPFYIAPHCEFTEDNRPRDCKFKLSFTGEGWKVLYNFIESLKQLGAQEQRYILCSYFASQVPEIGKKLYQLIITVRDETTITIEEGTWIPSFEHSDTIAGWN